MYSHFVCIMLYTRMSRILRLPVGLFHNNFFCEWKRIRVVVRLNPKSCFYLTFKAPIRVEYTQQHNTVSNCIWRQVFFHISFRIRDFFFLSFLMCIMFVQLSVFHSFILFMGPHFDIKSSLVPNHVLLLIVIYDQSVSIIRSINVT